MQQYILYSNSEVVKCEKDLAFDLITKGWILYAIADDDQMAAELMEETCFLAY